MIADEHVLRSYVEIRTEALKDAVENLPDSDHKASARKMFSELNRHIAKERYGHAAALVGMLQILVDVQDATHAERIADALRIARRKGGAKTAATTKKTVDKRAQALKAAARGVLQSKPWLSKNRLAEILAERGHGGAEGIKKRLRKIL